MTPEIRDMLYYGMSTFTTLRVENGTPAYWKQHLERLKSTAEHFGFMFPGYGALESGLSRLNLAIGLFRVRITLGEKQWFMDAQPLIIDPAIYQGVSVIVSQWQVHPQLAKYKLGNYMPYLLAHREAVTQGAYEALLCDQDGNIVDGSRSCPMWLSDDRLEYVEGGLDSISRQTVIQQAKLMGLQVLCRRGAGTGQLILSNSLIGVVPVGTPRFDSVRALLTGPAGSASYMY